MITSKIKQLLNYVTEDAITSGLGVDAIRNMLPSAQVIDQTGTVGLCQQSRRLFAEYYGIALAVVVAK